MEQIPLNTVVEPENDRYWKDGESVTLLPYNSRMKRIVGYLNGNDKIRPIIIDIPKIPKDGSICFSYYFIFYTLNGDRREYKKFNVFVIIKRDDEKGARVRLVTNSKEFTYISNEINKKYWPKRVKSKNNEIKLTCDLNDYSLSCEFNDLPLFEELFIRERYKNSVNLDYSNLSFEAYQIIDPIRLIVRIPDKEEIGVVDKRTFTKLQYTSLLCIGAIVYLIIAINYMIYS